MMHPETTPNNFETQPQFFYSYPFQFQPLTFFAPNLPQNPPSIEQVPHNFTQTNQPIKENSMAELRKHYQPKILENCQRTARVILIYELDQRLAHKKSLRLELNEILSQFVPNKKNESQDEDFERKPNAKYYYSVNYSRVKIGQKKFQKSILFNPSFKDELMEIFRKGNLHNSEKPRKNERSKISFSERKEILQKILQINQSNFLASMKLVPNTHESSNIQAVSLAEEENKSKQMEVQIKQNSSELQNKIETPYVTVPFPIFSVPLRPMEYQNYMEKKGHY